MKNVILKICAICIFSQLSNYVNAQVTIGSGSTPIKGSLLDIKQTDDEGSNSTKGILFPRVALIAIDQLEPCTITDEANNNAIHTGLTVYNITNDITGRLEEGIYAWNGQRWRSQVIEKLAGSGATNDINQNIMTTAANANNIAKGTIIEFADPLSVNVDGFYMFNLRIYGQYTGTTTLSGGYAFYLGLFKKAMGSDTEVMVDCAEINLMKSTLNVTTYSANLGGEFNYGDNAILRISHHPTAGTELTLLKAKNSLAANKTSLIWWKL